MYDCRLFKNFGPHIDKCFENNYDVKFFVGFRTDIESTEMFISSSLEHVFIYASCPLFNYCRFYVNKDLFSHLNSK